MGFSWLGFGILWIPPFACHAIDLYELEATCPIDSYPFLMGDSDTTTESIQAWAGVIPQSERISDHLRPHSNPSYEIDAIIDVDGKPLPSPWRSSPTCQRPRGSPFNHEEYCAFTDPTFSSGRSISIITSHERLEILAAQPPFHLIDTPTALSSSLVLKTSLLQQGSTSTSTISTSANPTNTTTPKPSSTPHKPYQPTRIPGKGFGLIATDPVPAGTLIMTSLPALMVDADAWKGFSRTPDDQLKLDGIIVEGIAGLSEALWAEVMALDAGKDAGEGSMGLGVARVNSFRTRVKIMGRGGDRGGRGRGGRGKGEMVFHGVFPEVSRLNHDCAPNLGYYFDSATMELRVTAVRDIAPGEELTISYVDTIQPHGTRHSRLWETWEFTCTCRRCSQWRSESDHRVTQMIKLRSELDNYTSSSSAIPNMAEEFVKLHEVEEQQMRIHEAYYRAALEWNGIGNAVEATRNAKLCLANGVLLRGGDKPFVESMRALVKEPERHWSWRFRIGERHQSYNDRGH